MLKSVKYFLRLIIKLEEFKYSLSNNKDIIGIISAIPKSSKSIDTTIKETRKNPSFFSCLLKRVNSFFIIYLLQKI